MGGLEKAALNLNSVHLSSPGSSKEKRLILTSNMPSSDINNDYLAATGQTTAAEGDVISASPSSVMDEDIEKQHSSTCSDDAIQDQVDIQYAEQQFADLKRRYLNLSRAASASSQELRRGGSDSLDSERDKSRVKENDCEEEEFDLEDVLRDRQRKEVEQDIKPKHLGILSRLSNC